MNYHDTFIEVADDCPATAAQVPEQKDGSPTVSALQYQMMAGHPSRYTQEDVLFRVFAARQGILPAQQAAERVAHEAEQARQRFEALAAQFGHEAATKIVGRELWVGETAAMVKASFGEPVDVSESVLKTKVKHTFKFDRLPGNNRFGLKVHLDDGVVVGWDRAND